MKYGTLARLLVASASLVIALPSHAFDEDAAKALAKKNDCFKCHSVSKDKKGPSLKKIAAKFAGEPDGLQKVIDSMTSGHMVKFDDGTEEEHKIINTDDAAAIKNLAEWILSN